MAAGAIIAGVLSVVVYFLGVFLKFSEREKIASSALIASTVCFATSGFLLSQSIGFFALGLCLAVLAILLGYEAGGE